jgi:antitoxin (DNA-binding transcriptional repressor) of toxin-antitoxin stability system
MVAVAVQEAAEHLAELIEHAAQGQEVIITRPDGLAFRLVPVPQAERRPKFGSARGLIKMAPDFDDPLEDFEEYGP